MLTNISKVADNVFAWTVVNGFSLVQQYQSIEKWKKWNAEADGSS